MVRGAEGYFGSERTEERGPYLYDVRTEWGRWYLKRREKDKNQLNPLLVKKG